MKVAHPFLRFLALLFCAIAPALAQEEMPDPSKIDPAEVYFQGWLSHSEAVDFHDDEKIEEAFDSLRQARRFLDAVALYHPDWKPDLVKKKREEISSLLKTVTPKMNALNTAGGAPALYSDGADPAVTTPPSPRLSDEQIQQASRISSQLADLQKRLNQSEDLRNADVARLQRQITELKTERDQLAASTLSKEVRQLKNRLDLVEREKGLLARQLSDARGELQAANERLADLDSKEKLARQRANELNAMLEKERGVSNDVITAFRSELKTVQKELSKTRTLLDAERQRSARLEVLLTEARSEVESLTSERDKIATERDDLAELLKLNQGDRLQKLIEQNMTLARDIREAKENLDALAKSDDANRDELNIAKRDLAMAKDQIIQLRQEKENESLRSLSIEQKLRDALAEIESRSSLADIDSDLREENEVLRKVIEKNLAVQKRRRESGQLLLQQLAEQGKNDTDAQMRQAAIQLLGEEIALTAEEQLMIDTSRPDGTFRFDDERASPEEVRQSGVQLRRRIDALTSSIKRTYSKGKLNVALELCEEILEEHPGHIETMLNQGAIRYRKGLLDQSLESFENAVAMRTTPIPYAHYMIGAVQFAKNDIEKATAELELAVRYNPTNIEAQNLLGVVHAAKGDLEKASVCFETANKLNPQHLEALMNLCYLHQNLKDKPKALEYYQQYRKAGGSPDPEIEKLFAQPKEPTKEVTKTE